MALFKKSQKKLILILRILIIYSLPVLVSLGCALPRPPVQNPAAAVRTSEVRDVPFDARQGEDIRKRVVVLPVIDTDLMRSENVAEHSRRAIVQELLNTRQFVVIDNADFPNGLQPFIKENREYDISALAKMAAQMGVSAIIEGKIIEVRARRLGDDLGIFKKTKDIVDVTTQVRVFFARTGKEIYSTLKNATHEMQKTSVASTASNRDLAEDPLLVREGVRKAFFSALPDVVKSIEKLNWEGRVALINGDRIYLNAGRLSGLQLGDILKVSEEGQEIFDPDTGAFIGSAPGRMKGTIEVVSYFGTDGAIAIIHSGSGFRENDRVELY